MYFVVIYENRRMKPVEIVLRREEEGRRRMEEVNLRYIINTYINITVYPLVQLLYSNKNFLISRKGKKKKTPHSVRMLAELSF
jgi:hypothetical protein